MSSNQYQQKTQLRWYANQGIEGNKVLVIVRIDNLRIELEWFEGSLTIQEEWKNNKDVICDIITASICMVYNSNYSKSWREHAWAYMVCTFILIVYTIGDICTGKKYKVKLLTILN